MVQGYSESDVEGFFEEHSTRTIANTRMKELFIANIILSCYS